MNKSKIEQFSKGRAYLAPRAYDAEEQRLQAEFGPLDLDEAERATFADVLRLRIGSVLDQRQARVKLQTLRRGLRDRVKTQLAEAKARGEEVSAYNVDGAHRIHSRDGLAALWTSGSLTDRQFHAGRAYRRRYELVCEGLKSGLRESTSGTQWHEQIGLQNRIKAAMGRERMLVDLAVVQRMRETPAALSLLRRIAGDGFTLTSQTGSGRAYGNGLRLLVGALDIAAEILPSEGD